MYAVIGRVRIKPGQEEQTRSMIAEGGVSMIQSMARAGAAYAFGEYDGVFLLEAPDNASAAALAMAVGSGGALSEVETTVLLDMDEAQDAMRKAAAATYRPPGS
jgi:uncharacterized protein with GYD domain